MIGGITPVLLAAQRSRNSGRRFSAKARGPSLASSLANTAMPACASAANASFSGRPSVSRMTRRMARTATGPLAAITGSGGSYTATFTAPAGAKVTLRTRAADAAGGSVAETITSGYRISS